MSATRLTGEQLERQRLVWMFLFDRDILAEFVAAKNGFTRMEHVALLPSGTGFEGLLPDGHTVFGELSEGNGCHLRITLPPSTNWEPVLVLDCVSPLGEPLCLHTNQDRSRLQKSSHSLAAATNPERGKWVVRSNGEGVAFQLSAEHCGRVVDLTLLSAETAPVPSAVELRFENSETADLSDAILTHEIPGTDVFVERRNRMDLSTSEQSLLSLLPEHPKHANVIRTSFRIPRGYSPDQWLSLYAHYGGSAASGVGNVTQVTHAADGSRFARRRAHQFFDTSQGFLLTLGERGELSKDAFDLVDQSLERVSRGIGRVDVEDTLQEVKLRLFERIQMGELTPLLEGCGSDARRYVARAVSNSIVDVQRERRRLSEIGVKPMIDDLPEDLLTARRHDRLSGLGDQFPFSGIQDFASWLDLRNRAVKTLYSHEAPKTVRHALLLRMLMGTSWKEIADVLGVSDSGLRGSVSRFMQCLSK